MTERRRRTGDEAAPAARVALHALGLATRIVMLIIGIGALVIAITGTVSIRTQPQGGNLWLPIEAFVVALAYLVGVVFTGTVVLGMIVEQVNKRLPRPWGTRARAKDKPDERDESA